MFQPKTYSEFISHVTKKREEQQIRAKNAPKLKKKVKKVKTLEERRSMARWHKLVWDECKRIIRSRYVNKDGTWTCYTCGKTIYKAQDCHTGHGKAKSLLKIKYKYDLRNLRPQCYSCNVDHGGMTDIYIGKLQKEEAGLQFLKETCSYYEGIWVISHKDDVSQARDYLPTLLDRLSLINV